MGARPTSATLAAVYAVGLACAAAFETTESVALSRERLASNYFAALIDVRTQEEWDSGHLPNATLMASLHETRDTNALEVCRGCRLAVYCRTGVRAGEAAALLESRGYVVYNVLGVTQWEEDGVALVTTPSQPTACAETMEACGLGAPPPAAPPPGIDVTTLALAIALPVVGALGLGAAAYLWCRHRRRKPGAFGA
jgi:rhodanese-related sulfurtransferase